MKTTFEARYRVHMFRFFKSTPGKHSTSRLTLPVSTHRLRQPRRRRRPDTSSAGRPGTPQAARLLMKFGPLRRKRWTEPSLIINLSLRSLSPKPELGHLLHYSTSVPSSDMNIAEKAATPREPR